MTKTILHDRSLGALLGCAIGDAIGGATEGWSPAQIRDRWGGWVEGIVGPYFEDWKTAVPMSPLHKGDGHTTDDTLLTVLLAEVYTEVGRHLTAFDIADYLVPKLINQKVWIPDLEMETVPLQRIFLAEKWLALRLHWGHVDPREAGVGNAVNCGAAMYVTATGLVNAGDPDTAYAEAIEITSAHQSSYGREAAGVMAAAVATAAGATASLDDVFAACLRLAKDGTRDAIEAVLDASDGISHWTEAIESGKLRNAIRPFDTVADTYKDQGLGARRPSRIHSIEELPVALGMLKISNADVLETVLGGTNYGRDSDSIASMGAAIAGALGGTAVIPSALADTIVSASRLDLETPAFSLADVAHRIRQDDAERYQSIMSEAVALGATAQTN